MKNEDIKRATAEFEKDLLLLVMDAFETAYREMQKQQDKLREERQDKGEALEAFNAACTISKVTLLKLRKNVTGDETEM